MFKRYRKWRDRRWWKSLDSRVGKTLNGDPCRTTYRKGRLFAVEIWHKMPGRDDEPPHYAYTIFKTPPKGKHRG